MRYHRNHLEYLPILTGGPMGIYSPTRPPCNTIIGEAAYAIAIIASAASAYVSYDSAQTAAKQSEYNAEAQSKAIASEQQRQAMEQEENRRRAVQEQRRFRAQQLADMSSSGAMIGTGTSLAIEADTWAKQQTELADQQRMNEAQMEFAEFQRQNTLDMGSQQAAAMRREGTGQAISGIASAAGGIYQSWSTRPQTTKAA